jgi:rod shape-determining protein MreC
MEARLQLLAALEAENARLRALMDSPAKLADRVQMAEILARSISILTGIVLR